MIAKQFLESGAIISMGNGHYLLGYGKRTWLSNPRQLSQPHFYFPDFFLKQKTPWFTHEHVVELDGTSLSNYLMPFVSLSDPICQWSNGYYPLFENVFKDLQHHFFLKKLHKAVPFVFETTDTCMDTSLLARALINTLTYASATPTCLYGFWELGEGMLGATPELLFGLEKKDSMILHTMACAGTARVGEGKLLMDSPKDLREHQLVVDGIVESLKPFGTIRLGSLRVLDLPKLSHLVTPIEAELNREASIEELVTALHPTPALGAFPRNAGQEWLLYYQTLIDRRRFGAPVGYWMEQRGVKRFSAWVAIRNVQWDAKGMAIGAGCGIVAQSILDAEWREIETKIRAIKHFMMGL